ncbi:hypothetical protein ABZ858_31400 [Streptomyces sp. NPDC047017]|uniref:hypothetical protein n=1 Tax=Streptomyces sp. NPDC047017 TaxID=3155024 RepID=UPI0033F6FA75
MHMNSVPQHLLSEDRREFERILDEALRSAPYRPEPAAVGQRLTTEQLRTMALSATALITAAAATEYQHYVEVREESRRPAPAVPSAARDATPDGTAGAAGAGTEPAAGPEETGGADGAGAAAVVAVLAPVLAGIAAAVFLLVGYLLKLLDPAPAFARTLITAGWVFGAVTAAAILIAGGGLLATALRNHPAPGTGPYGALGEELARARDAWHKALLERGILPFLHDALAAPGPAPAHRADPAAPDGRIPHLGYGRPGFSSPDAGAPGPRPSFSSPDFSSPDFGGPDHRPE